MQGTNPDMADESALNPADKALFEDDFKEVPLDESADQTVKKNEKTSKNQKASLDILDGLVQQAKMEEIVPEDDEIQEPSKTSEPKIDDTKPDASNPVSPETSPTASLSSNYQMPAETSGPSSDTATILSADALLNAPVATEDPHDADEELDDDGDPVASGPAAGTKPSAKPEYPEDSHMDALPAENLPPIRVLEAALFLANKPMSHKQLQDLLQVPRDRLDALLGELGTIVPKESSFELSVNEHGAALQLKPHYLHRVARLSKEVELSKKSMRILALVAKKKELMQSDLKHFFKGEIYAYVTELKMAGYLESKKAGNTRKLKPTTKFFESFQVKEA